MATKVGGVERHVGLLDEVWEKIVYEFDVSRNVRARKRAQRGRGAVSLRNCPRSDEQSDGFPLLHIMKIRICSTLWEMMVRVG